MSPVVHFAVEGMRDHFFDFVHQWLFPLIKHKMQMPSIVFVDMRHSHQQIHTAEKSHFCTLALTLVAPVYFKSSRDENQHTRLAPLLSHDTCEKKY